MSTIAQYADAPSPFRLKKLHAIRNTFKGSVWALARAGVPEADGTDSFPETDIDPDEGESFRI